MFVPVSGWPHSVETSWKLIAIGGSSGAIPAFFELLGALPRNFPIPIVVVQHLGTGFVSRLPHVLGYRTGLDCRWAEHGAALIPGVHVAPAGLNIAVSRDEMLLLSTGPKPRTGSPSIDVFFESAALCFGRHLIGVVLSGALHDGARGIAAVRKSGGATLAQCLKTSGCRDMPTAAIDLGRADLALSPARIADALMILAERGVE